MLSNTVTASSASSARRTAADYLARLHRALLSEEGLPQSALWRANLRVQPTYRFLGPDDATVGFLFSARAQKGSDGPPLTGYCFIHLAACFTGLTAVHARRLETAALDSDATSWRLPMVRQWLAEVGPPSGPVHCQLIGAEPEVFAAFDLSASPDDAYVREDSESIDASTGATDAMPESPTEWRTQGALWFEDCWPLGGRVIVAQYLALPSGNQWRAFDIAATWGLLLGACRLPGEA